MGTIRRKNLEYLLKENKAVICLELLIVFGLVIGFAALFKPLAGGNQFLAQGIVWLANIVLISLVWSSQFLRGEGISQLGLKVRPVHRKAVLKNLSASLLIFVLAALAFVLSEEIIRFSGIDAPSEIAPNYDYFRQNPIIFLISFLGVLVVSSFGEELVYRGYLIHRLLDVLPQGSYRNFLAVLISAVIFGGAHYQWGIIGILQTLFVGLVFATSYLILGKRLVPLILAHAYMDSLLLASIYFNG